MKQHNLHAPGNKLKHYEIIKLLGAGGYAKVYHAINFQTGLNVAIKAVAMSTFKNHGGLVGELHESEKMLMKMIDSENVIKYIDEFQQNKYSYIVMEYQGDIENLWINNNKNFNEIQALQYTKQIIQGMKDMHKVGIMHRDIKMRNILLNDDKIKIGDLGFRKRLNLTIGMLGYMAPEVSLSQEYTQSADIFSIGCLLYQMLYGILPYSDKNHQLFLNEAKKKKPIHQEFVSYETQRLIDEMLQYDLNKRITWEQLYQHFGII